MKPLLLLALAATAAWGQGTASLRARELFYTPPPGAAAAKPQVASPAPPAAVSATAPKTPAPKTMAKKNPAQTSQSPSQASVSPTAPTQAVVDNPAAVSPLGMRYSVLKRNASGQYQEVDVDTTFHSGDRIRLEAQANTTGYLYVVAQGSSGNWQVLFPSREVSNGSNQVHRGETRLVPGGNQGQFVFDEQAGTEKLFFVLSRQPEPSLDKLIYSMGGETAPADPAVAKPAAEPARVLMAQATVSDDVISRIRGQVLARDLIFEKVENEKVVAENNASAEQPGEDRDRRLCGQPQYRAGCAVGGRSEVEAPVVMRRFFQVAAALVSLNAMNALWAQEPQRIRVSVERQDSAGWIAVNPAHVFEHNDRLRFHISTTFGGFLYVMDQGTSGGYELLFPRSDTGSDNRIEAGKDYVIPVSQGFFKVSGPPGHDVIYWLVSPVDLGKQYQPLPPPPALDSMQLKLHPRCDDSILKARGDCIDTQAGVRPVKSGDKLPENMNGVVKATPRELLFIQDNSIGKESVVVSSPAPLSGPVVYELRLAHR